MRIVGRSGRRERNHHGPERSHVRPLHFDSTPPSVQIQGGSTPGAEATLSDAATGSGEQERANAS